ncbi:MAG: hypothetical protein J7501_00645 [Bdellovibrio sp.]|nr:hypothetical protein [Bdellovibrio sp.]
MLLVFSMLFFFPEIGKADRISCSYDPSSPQANCPANYVCLSTGSGRSAYACRPAQCQQNYTECPSGKVLKYQNGACTCAATSSSSTASVGSCQQQLASLVQACNDSVSSADNYCDEKNSKEMNSVSSQASAIALAFSSQTAASVQAACSQSAMLSQAANAAVAAYRMACSGAIESCSSACDAATAYYNQTKGCSDTSTTTLNSQATTLKKQCLNYTARTDQAQQAIQNYALTASNGANCASETSADDNTLAAICEKNPSLAGCSNTIADCNNPSMASNKVCVCAKNPNDPQCLGTSSTVTDGGSLNTGNMDMSSRLTSNSAGAENLLGDIPDTPGIAQGKANAGGAAGVDGKQGNGANLGGNSDGHGGGSAGSKGAAGEAEANGSAVNAGFYGGGGGGGGSWGGGDGSGGGGGGLFGSAAAAIAAKGGPDLRQFLPGGKLAPGARGIAGASGPDGITGPHTDIWKKVNNRYQVMSTTLLP